MRRAHHDKLLYSTQVSLDGTQMQIEDKMVNLAPGMAVTVEIKTGTAGTASSTVDCKSI